MTLDREIRFSPKEITIATLALRDEVKKRNRSIEKAEASRAAGVRIQHGVLQEHYEARDLARGLIEKLEVARKQIGHQIAYRLQQEASA